MAGLLWSSAIAVGNAKTGQRLWIFGAKVTNPAVEGGKAKGSLLVSNPGLAPVEVRVEPGCGCESLTPGSFRLDGLTSRSIEYTIDLADSAPGYRTKGLGLICHIGASTEPGRTWEEPIVLAFEVRPKEERKR